MVAAEIIGCEYLTLDAQVKSGFRFSRNARKPSPKSLDENPAWNCAVVSAVSSVNRKSL